MGFKERQSRPICCIKQNFGWLLPLNRICLIPLLWFSPPRTFAALCRDSFPGHPVPSQCTESPLMPESGCPAGSCQLLQGFSGWSLLSMSQFGPNQAESLSYRTQNSTANSVMADLQKNLRMRSSSVKTRNIWARTEGWWISHSDLGAEGLFLSKSKQ